MKIKDRKCQYKLIRVIKTQNLKKPISHIKLGEAIGNMWKRLQSTWQIPLKLGKFIMYPLTLLPSIELKGTQDSFLTNIGI